MQELNVTLMQLEFLKIADKLVSNTSLAAVRKVVFLFHRHSFSTTFSV
jgi:hypothetical protein